LNKGKNQNSILVLATLGVYLGLVLAGGTPQVWAQAATAKQFSVKDEVGQKDDLDKRPDPSIDALSLSFNTYFRNVKEFVDDLTKLYSIEKFDPDWNTFDSQKTGITPCPATGIGRSHLKESHGDRWLTPAIEQAHFASDDWSWLADCRAFKSDEEPNWKKAKSTGIHLTFDKKDIVYKISIEKSTPQRSESPHTSLSQAFEVFKVDDDDSRLKVLFQHTSLYRSGNQVFIVTRLPRADLDALLATNVK